MWTALDGAGYGSRSARRLWWQEMTRQMDLKRSGRLRAAAAALEGSDARPAWLDAGKQRRRAERDVRHDHCGANSLPTARDPSRTALLGSSPADEILDVL